MFEQEMVDGIKEAGVSLVVSLPCDKNKGFTDAIHRSMDVVDVTREEDGVGICAGAYLCGRRAVISIQSSGLGNMMNAIMSLSDFYGLPLVVLASWRGMEGETIGAQIPFNSKIPRMLECYGIECHDLRCGSDVPRVSGIVRDAFDGRRISVILIRPELWGEYGKADASYPSRRRRVHLSVDKEVRNPTMTRLDAIAAVMAEVDDEDIVVSNIGVPSKEAFASRDRPLNFYMLGSYTQATPIGLGMALSSDRRVIVLDGDGSLLGSSILPVLSSVAPGNLTVVCLDNGTFGSTGNQVNQAYSDVDLATVAMAYGIQDVRTVYDGEGITSSLNRVHRMSFVHVMIVPFNSPSPNIPYPAPEIRDRFMGAL